MEFDMDMDGIDKAGCALVAIGAIVLVLLVGGYTLITGLPNTIEARAGARASDSYQARLDREQSAALAAERRAQSHEQFMQKAPVYLSAFVLVAAFVLVVAIVLHRITRPPPTQLHVPPHQIPSSTINIIQVSPPDQGRLDYWRQVEAAAQDQEPVQIELKQEGPLGE